MDSIVDCFSRVAALVAVMALAGCASQPSVQGVETISVRLGPGSDFSLDLVNVKDPETKPGAMAAEGVSMAMSDCFDESQPAMSFFIMPLCAAVGAAAGGATGAMVSRNTLPPNEAVNLRAATRQSGGGLAFKQKLKGLLEQMGRDRGKVVVTYPEGAGISLTLVNFEWQVSLGNRAAMVGEFEVATGGSENPASKRFRISSVKLPVDAWASDNGARVRAEIDAFAADASSRAWIIVDGEA